MTIHVKSEVPSFLRAPNTLRCLSCLLLPSPAAGCSSNCLLQAMVDPSGSCSSAVSHSLASAQQVLEAAPAVSMPAGGASVHSSPSMLAPATAGPNQHAQQDQQQQQHADCTAPQQQHQQQPQQQEVNPPDTAAQAASMQRLGGALQDVLSSQLSSDFVEGLKPVMLKGSLQISTHIQLAGEAAPLFIGLFPTLQAAVDAQKQSQALVSCCCWRAV